MGIESLGQSVLIDPVFSRRIGGLIPRLQPAGPDLEEFQTPTALLITHNHRDHLDEPTVRRLSRQTPVVVPPGLGRWFCRRGFVEAIELRWWEQVMIGPFEVTAVPACHWSRRGLWDTNRSGWCGFVIRSPGGTVYHAGDTGWFDRFGDVARAFPDLDLVLMPVGGYAPGWLMGRHHLTPEQAAEAFLATNGRTLVPIHWGTFRLSDEPAQEPIDRLRRWWETHPVPEDRRLVIPAPGIPIPIRADGG